MTSRANTKDMILRLVENLSGYGTDIFLECLSRTHIKRLYSSSSLILLGLMAPESILMGGVTEYFSEGAL